MTTKQFKDARELLGMTQQDFAVALGYTMGTMISRKELGVATITRADEIIIAGLLEKYSKPSKSKRHAK